jgi:translation elongation factor EF-Ts
VPDGARGDVGLGDLAPRDGRLHTRLDTVLLEQPSVTESTKTVKAVLDEAGVTLKRFARFEVGA